MIAAKLLFWQGLFFVLCLGILEHMENVNALFIELEERIREQGLFRRRTGFYSYRFALTTIGLSFGVAILITIGNFWIQMFNAVFLAFIFGQVALLLHDVGHGQVAGGRVYRMMSMWFSVSTGWNVEWWAQKHNRHHAFPNQPGFDPDIDIALLAFFEDQARKKKGMYRVVVKHQSLLFIPMLMGESWHLRYASIAYLFRQRTPKAIVDLFLAVVHLILYFGIIFFFFPGWQGLFWIVVQSGLLGIYLGLIFAPNHKGMPIVEHGAVPGFLEQQVLTSRNVQGGLLADIIYGGLNYQIEHHLFPSMPRINLPNAAPIVEAFCREKNISYSAVDIRESFREIFGYLHRIGKSAIITP